MPRHDEATVRPEPGDRPQIGMAHVGLLGRRDALEVGGRTGTEELSPEEYAAIDAAMAG